MKLNLTPIIDVVFQLIIFLIIVYQRIDAENFRLDVPQRCTYAISDNNSEKSPPTISVFDNPSDGKTTFAVGADKCPFQSPTDIANWLILHINKETSGKKLTTLQLRIDKTIKYRDSQLVLAAAAKSNATNLEISTTKENVNPK